MGRTPRRRWSPQRKESSWVLQATLLVALLFIVAAALFFLQSEDLDSISCPKDGPKSVTAVILDTSDPLLPHQIIAFKKFTDSLIRPPRDGEIVTANSDSYNYVPKNHLLVVYEIADKTGEPRQLFKQCNPGNPESRGMRGKLNEGKILANIRWSNFTNELANVFPKEILQKSAPVSPLIETIRYVRRAEFPSTPELKATEQTAGVIFIVSDMLQKSDKLTHFKKSLPKVEDIPAEFALDLTGIEIGIRYLKSEKYKHLQQGVRPHFTWWRKFFAVAGSPLNRPLGVW